MARRRVPFVQQLSAAECGAACLAMVLAYHGRPVGLAEVREVLGASRDGTTARALLEAARVFGLEGEGVSLDLDALGELAPAAILHWDFDHFVLLERARRRGGADIVDPALGPRSVASDEMRRAFTGVALQLRPGVGFQPAPPRRVPWGRYLRPVLAHRGHWARVIGASLLLLSYALAVPALTGAVVDRVVPHGDRSLLSVLAAGLCALVFFDFATSLVRAHLLLDLRTRIDARMALDFLRHMVDLPYSFFQTRAAGDLIMRLDSNATLREVLTSASLSAVLDGALVVLYLALLLAASPSMGALILALGAAQIGIFLATRRQAQDLMARSLQAQSRTESFQVELLAGMESLKAMGSEHRAVDHWHGLFSGTLSASVARGRLHALIDSLTASLRLAAPLVVLSYGSLRVMEGEFTLGAMLALNALAAGFLGPLATLVVTAERLQILGSYVERLEDVLGTPPEQDPSAVQPAGRLRGRIELEGVSFRYGPRSRDVLRDVTLAIAPGELVALVGRSGSGKSTLAALLVGLHRPRAGRVLYDGVDLATLEARSVRRQMGVVPQHAYLFAGSIRHNIALAEPGASLDEIQHAARLSQIHDEIAELPMGYDTVLVDAGASLAGGQRQRLALARALVRRPAVLVLDEATSALDAVTERAVQASLSGLRCTRVVIAHRLSTVAEADRILVLHDGRVVEAGRHEELLAQGGPYARLVGAQLW